VPGLGNLSRDIQGREITMMVRVASVRVSGGGVGDAGLVFFFVRGRKKKNRIRKKSLNSLDYTRTRYRVVCVRAQHYTPVLFWDCIFNIFRSTLVSRVTNILTRDSSTKKEKPKKRN
jgi:hypothetical protein